MKGSGNHSPNSRQTWPQGRYIAILIGNLVGIAIAAYGYFFSAELVKISPLLVQAGISQFADTIATVTTAAGIWYLVIVNLAIYKIDAHGPGIESSRR